MFDLGGIRVIPHLLSDKYLNEATLANCRKALYHDDQSNYCVSPLSITEDVLHDFYAQFPDKGIFGLGGVHSVSYPLTKAYLQAKKKQGKRTAIIHFDAHTDLLIERLGIDLCFGSWCTHILDDLPVPEHLIQVGIRSTGKSKQHWEITILMSYMLVLILMPLIKFLQAQQVHLSLMVCYQKKQCKYYKLLPLNTLLPAVI